MLPPDNAPVAVLLQHPDPRFVHELAFHHAIAHYDDSLKDWYIFPNGWLRDRPSITLCYWAPLPPIPPDLTRSLQRQEPL